MNVTSLPVEERLRLFNLWVKDREELNSKYEGCIPFEEYNEGNHIDITDEQLKDPTYIIPEWNTTLPVFCFDEKLYEKIGRKVYLNGRNGIFLGINCTYVDFYYKIKFGDNIEYISCVANLKFL